MSTKGLNAASKCMPFTMNKIFTCTRDFLIILLRWRFIVFLIINLAKYLKLQKNTNGLRQQLLGHFHPTLFFSLLARLLVLPMLVIAFSSPNLAHQHWEGKKIANCLNNFDWDCTGYLVFLYLFKRFTTMGTHIRRLIYQVSFSG